MNPASFIRKSTSMEEIMAQKIMPASSFLGSESEDVHSLSMRQISPYRSTTSESSKKIAHSIIVQAQDYSAFKRMDRVEWLYKNKSFDAMSIFEAQHSPTKILGITDVPLATLTRRKILNDKIRTQGVSPSKVSRNSEETMDVSSSASSSSLLSASSSTPFPFTPTTSNNTESNIYGTASSVSSSVLSFTSPSSVGGMAGSFLENQSFADESSLPRQTTTTSSHKSFPATVSVTPTPLPKEYITSPRTNLYTIYSKYRVAISVDLSPSMASVDPIAGDVLFDRVFRVLEKTLYSLCSKIEISGDIRPEANPEIHLTVMAFGAVHKPIITLFQDVVLNRDNVNAVYSLIEQGLRNAEHDAAKALSALSKKASSQKSKKESKWYSADFHTVIYNSLIALDFMPKDACPTLIIVTDGVFTLTDLKLDVALKLNSSDTTLCIVNIADKTQHAECLYSYISNQELLEYVAKATEGTLVEYSYYGDDEPISAAEMASQRRLHTLQNMLLMKFTSFNMASIYSKASIYTPMTYGSRRQLEDRESVGFSGIIERLKEYKLANVSATTLLKMRSIQGFIVDEIQYPNEERPSHGLLSRAENLSFAQMRFLFKPNVEVEYIIRAATESSEAQESHKIARMEEKRAKTVKEKQLGQSMMNDVQLSTAWSVEIYLHASKTFHEKLKAFKTKYAKERAALDLSNVYALLLEFIYAIQSEDKIAEHLHGIAVQAPTTTPSSRSSQSMLATLSYINEKPGSGSWFDTESITVLLSDKALLQPEHMGEVLIHNLAQGIRKPQQYGSNVNSTTDAIFLAHQGMMNSLSQVIADSTIRINKDICIQYLPSTSALPLVFTMQSADLSEKTIRQSSSGDYLDTHGFCLVKVVWHSHALAEIMLRFFNVSAFVRSEYSRFLRKNIKNLNLLTPAAKIVEKEKIAVQPTVSPKKFRILKKNVAAKLISKIPKCTDEEQQYNQQLYYYIPHYTSYLYHRKWCWNCTDSKMSPILNVIFAQRLREGFSLVSLNFSAIFMKEIPFITQSQSKEVFYLFYSTHLLRKERKIITEIWLEPRHGVITLDRETNFTVETSQLVEDMNSWFATVDRDIISLYCTFSLVQNACVNNVNLEKEAPMLSITDSSLQSDKAAIPFNVFSLVDRGTKRFLSFFKVSSTSEQQKNVLSINLDLSTKLLKTASLLNDLEISLAPEPKENKRRPSQGTTSCSRCFLRFVQNPEDEEKTLVITFLPVVTLPENQNKISALLCDITYSQLSAIDAVNTPCNNIYKLIFDQLQIRKANTIAPLAEPGMLSLDESIASPPSLIESEDRYSDFLAEVMNCYYVNSVFRSLQIQEKLTSDSIVRAIESCFEYSAEIDLTELVESLLLTKEYFFKPIDSSQRSPYEEMNRYFQFAVQKYFEHLPGSTHHFYLRDTTPTPSPSTPPTQPPQVMNPFDNEYEFGSDDEKPSKSKTEETGDEEEVEKVKRKKHQAQDLFEILSYKSADYFSENSVASQQALTYESSVITPEEIDKLSVPVFFRMECVSMSQPDWDQEYDITTASSTVYPVTSTIPIEKISSVLHSGLVKSKEDEVNPFDTIGDEKETLASALNMTKSMLRLVCITLPPDKLPIASGNFQPQSRALMKHLMHNHDSNRFLFAKSRFMLETQQEVNNVEALFMPSSLLPGKARKLMTKTKKRMQALISKEILNALLHTSSISGYVLDKVFKHIKNLPPTCYTKHLIPLHFVDLQHGPQLFQAEITKCKSLMIKKVDKYFLVYFQKNKDFAYYTYQEAKQTGFTSISADAALYDDYLDTDTEETEKHEVELPYWLILTVKSSSVTVFLYSPYPVSRSKKDWAIKRVETAVLAICKRVNAVTLLGDLHDTRLCSAMLIPPSPRDAELMLKGEMDTNAFDETFLKKQNGQIFKEGSLACPMVHEIKFALHGRLQPDVALGTLATSVLHPFQVANRLNVFVYKERSGRVFYLRLRDSKQDDAFHIEKLHSPAEDNMGFEEEEEDNEESESTTTRARKNFSLSLASVGNYLYAHLNIQTNKSFLILEVYGVNKPTAEITNQLHLLVENKISNMTLSVISSLLLRNSQFKLNVEDLEFIRPYSKKPDEAILVEIPSAIKLPYLFMLLLRQNLLSYLSRLYLSSSTSRDAESSALSATDDEGDIEEELKSREGNYFVFKPLNFSFLFNSVVSNNYSSSLASALGKGIACIHLSVVNSEGKFVKKFPAEDFQTLSATTLTPEEHQLLFSWDNLKVTSATDMEFDDDVVEEIDEQPTSSPNTNYSILIEVWGKGDIDSSSLGDRIVLTINQSAIDYALEACLFSEPVVLPSFRDSFLSPFQNIGARARALSSPTVMETRHTVFVPLWAMEGFVAEIQKILSQYEIHVNPISLVSVDGKGEDFNLLHVPFSFAQQQTNLIDSMKKAVGSSTIFFTLLGGKLRIQTKQEKSSELNIASQSDFSSIVAFPEVAYRHVQRFQRNCVILITVTNLEIVVMTYNWKKTEFDNFKAEIARLVAWTKFRVHLLGAILNQKMGMFFHTPSANFSTIELPPSKETSAKSSKELQLTLSNIDVLIFNRNIIHKREEIPVAPTSVRTESPIAQVAPIPRGDPRGARPPHLDSFRSRTLQQRGIIKTPTGKASPTTLLQQPPGQQTVPVQQKRAKFAGSGSSSTVSTKQPVRKTVRHFGFLLKGIFDGTEDGVSEEMQRKQLSRISNAYNISNDDPLLLHGIQFKKIVQQNNQVAMEKNRVAKIYAQWQLPHGSLDHELTSKDFKTIKNTSRIFHICRVPMFFNQLRRIVFAPPSVTTGGRIKALTKAEASNSNLREISLQQHLLESFLREYIQYLTSIGITDLVVDQGTQTQETVLGSPMPRAKYGASGASTPAPSSPFQLPTGSSDSKADSKHQGRALVQINDEVIALQPTTVYFQKIMHGGVLLIELGFDSVYVVLNVYVSDVTEPNLIASQRYFAGSASGSNTRVSPSVNIEKYKSTRRQFLESTAQLKHKLHFNSFVYDFHVRSFYKFITSEAEFPATFELMSALRDFTSFYPQRRSFSRNNLITSETSVEISLPVNTSAVDFFKYMCANVDKYGCKNLAFRKIENVILLEHKVAYQSNEVNASAATPPSPIEAEDITNAKLDPRLAEYSYAVIVTMESALLDGIISESSTEQVESTPEKSTTGSFNRSTSFLLAASPKDLSGTSWASTSSIHESSVMTLRLHVVVNSDSSIQPIPDHEFEIGRLLIAETKKIMKAAENKLQHMIERATNHFKLDSLWSWLLGNKIREFEWDELLLLCQKIPLTHLDSSLECFSSPFAPWHDIIPYMINTAGEGNAIVVRRRDGTREHFILLCPEDKDVALHLDYLTLQNTVSMNLCRRRIEPIPESFETPQHQRKRSRSISLSAALSAAGSGNRHSGSSTFTSISELSPLSRKSSQKVNVTLSELEFSFINEFVNQVCHFMWKYALTDF